MTNNLAVAAIVLFAWATFIFTNRENKEEALAMYSYHAIALMSLTSNPFELASIRSDWCNNTERFSGELFYDHYLNLIREKESFFAKF